MIPPEKILFGDGPEFRVLNTQEMIQDNKNLSQMCFELVEACKNDDLNQFESAFTALSDKSRAFSVDNFFWLGDEPTTKSPFRTLLMIAATFGSTNVLAHIIDVKKADIAKISPYDNATALKCAESAAATPRRLDVIDKLNHAANPPKSWAKNLMEVGRPENIEAAYKMNDPSSFEGYVQDYPNLATTSNIRPTRSWLRRNPGRPICQPRVPEADG